MVAENYVLSIRKQPIRSAAIIQLDHRVRVFDGPRAKQQIETRKERRVDADAESERRHRQQCEARLLRQQSGAETQVLKHLVLQSSRLQKHRILERADNSSQQIEFCMAVEIVPFSQQLFARAQFGLPLLPPVGA